MAVVLGALLAVGVVSRYALLTVLLDGMTAAAVLVPAMLGGLWLVPLLRLGKLPLRWHFLAGAALGIGALSLIILLLGLVGALDRPIIVGVLIVAALAGVYRWHRITGDCDEFAAPPGGTRYLWILVTPFLTLALLAASHAPGFLWQEEGFAYDALEYHLQLPKEYIETGRIDYRPHNVYANFPANVEMLYLVGMMVTDDSAAGGTVAHMLHLMLGMLAVLAAWVAGREWSPRAGIVAGVMTASVGWLVYLSGLAYVENGMLFFGMTAAAALVRLMRENGAPTAPRLGWAALAGLAAGLACGCKYTALPMIAVPIGLATLLRSAGGGRRVADFAIFGACSLAAFAPWLIKNQLMTANPVFPLVNSVLEASPPGWEAEETARWDRGHGLGPAERSIGKRLTLAWNHLIGDRYHRFGPAIFLLALTGLTGRRRDRADLALVAIAGVQLLVWLFATHLFARFGVVLMIPLVLLCARAALPDCNVRRRFIVAGLVVAGAVWNFAFTAKLYATESPGDAPASLFTEGTLPGFEYLGAVNRELPADARVLLVGDAKAFYIQRPVEYCVTFNRSPFFERIAAGESTDSLLAWLVQRGYSHVVINWSELSRLAGTYGLSPDITPTRIEGMIGALRRAGMERVFAFPHPRTGGRYVEIYRVPG